MKRFQFRLGRVLDWRRTELELEERRLKQLHASIALLERERAALESAGDQASRALLTQAAVDGTELHALSAYRAAVTLQSIRLDQKRRQLQTDLAAQQQKLLEARRRLRLLENLKERRRVEWSYEAERQERTDQNGPFRAPRKIALTRSTQD
jgi:flagellar export protein FliJ